MKTLLFIALPLAVAALLLLASLLAPAAPGPALATHVEQQQPLCNLVRDLQRHRAEQTNMAPLAREAIDRLNEHCAALQQTTEVGLHDASTVPVLQQHLRAMSRWLTVAELAASTDAADLAQRATHRLDAVGPLLEAQRRAAHASTTAEPPPSLTLYNQYQFLRHRTQLLAEGRTFATPQARQQFILNMANLVTLVEAYHQQQHTAPEAVS